MAGLASFMFQRCYAGRIGHHSAVTPCVYLRFNIKSKIFEENGHGCHDVIPTPASIPVGRAPSAIPPQIGTAPAGRRPTDDGDHDTRRRRAGRHDAGAGERFHFRVIRCACRCGRGRADDRENLAPAEGDKRSARKGQTDSGGSAECLHARAGRSPPQTTHRLCVSAVGVHYNQVILPARLRRNAAPAASSAGAFLSVEPVSDARRRQSAT